MSAEHKIVGFDARISPTVPDPDWSSTRRRSFLLREDIDHPLSVDQKVWKPQYLQADDPEKWRGVLNHWSSLEDLRNATETNKPEISQSTWLVATTIVWDILPSDVQDFWLAECIEPTMPSRTPPDSIFLGYDVADRWLLSGLSNCGYVGDELTKWRNTWADKVSDTHLFPNMPDAIEFKARTNERVPEHAPFFVYGIFRLPVIA